MIQNAFFGVSPNIPNIPKIHREVGIDLVPGSRRSPGTRLLRPRGLSEVMVVEEKGSNIIYCTNMTRVLAQSLFD